MKGPIDVSRQETRVSSTRTFATQFHCTEAEYLSAHWAYLRHHPWKTFLHLRYPIVVVVASALVLFQYPNKWQRVGPLALLGSGILAFALLVHRRNWRQKFKDSPFGQDIVSASFNDQSVGFRLKGRDVVKGWEEILDIYESRLVFVFGWGKNGMVLLPKSGMSQSQIDELRTLFSDKRMSK